MAGKSFSVLKPYEQRSFNHPLIGLYEKAEDEFSLPGSLLSLSLRWVIKVFVCVCSLCVCVCVCVCVCMCVCLSVCLCESVDNEGNHCSSMSVVIINTASLGDFCSVINWAVMTDVHCIMCHRFWHDWRASKSLRLMNSNISIFLFYHGSHSSVWHLQELSKSNSSKNDASFKACARVGL